MQEEDLGILSSLLTTEATGHFPTSDPWMSWPFPVVYDTVVCKVKNPRNWIFFIFSPNAMNDTVSTKRTFANHQEIQFMTRYTSHLKLHPEFIPWNKWS